MKRAGVAVVAVLALTAGGAASAAVHQATVGNYYFQDDATGDRTKLVVDKGDQVTFTVRATASRPHSVNVDDLGIHSGDLLIFETYTTPPLTRAGTFRLYCRNHAVSNNHVASLVVRAPTTPSTPAATTTTLRRAPPPTTPTTLRSGVPAGPTTTLPATTTVVTPSTASPATSTSAVTVPAGRGKAPPGDRRRAPPSPGSLEAILGRRVGGNAPWTRGVRLSLIALVPLAAVAAFALREAHKRDTAA